MEVPANHAAGGIAGFPCGGGEKFGGKGGVCAADHQRKHEDAREQPWLQRLLDWIHRGVNSSLASRIRKQQTVISFYKVRSSGNSIGLFNAEFPAHKAAGR